MNPQELRIGNCVEFEGAIAVVAAICKAKEGYIDVSIPNSTTAETKVNEVKPVPLSKSTLIKYCHFDKHGKYNISVDKQAYDLKLEEGYIVLLDKKGEPMIHFWDVRYLHQLQNLYFALKGKEMPVTCE